MLGNIRIKQLELFSYDLKYFLKLSTKVKDNPHFIFNETKLF